MPFRRLRPRRPARGLSREVVLFCVVGGIGYVVDAGVFNLLRFAGDPALLADRPVTAKVLSVSAAVVVTYVGNRRWTWAAYASADRRREFALFVAFALVGMLIAVGCLAVSHYLLGLTSPLADNISANVVGFGIGTVFRFWAYRRFVFTAGRRGRPDPAGRPPRRTSADAR